MDKRTERNRRCRRRLFRKKKKQRRGGARGRAKTRTISVTRLSPPTLRSFKRDLEIERKKTTVRYYCSSH